MLGRRIQRHVKGYGSDDWSEADHIAIADLCSALINAARDLPVVYYAQYLDSWWFLVVLQGSLWRGSAS
jgi:hypothetical protein